MEQRTTVGGRHGNWALGSLAVFFFALEALTGLGLAFEFRPSPGSAYGEVLDLREASSLGWVAKLHYWGSHALVIVVWLHLLRMFMLRRYALPHRRDWILGVLLLVPILLLAATGARLPVDSGDATALSSHPPALSDSGAPSSPEVEAGELSQADPRRADPWRVYVLHCLLLPLVAAGLIFIHVRRARRGAASPADTSVGQEAG